MNLTDAEIRSLVQKKCYYCDRNGGGIDRINSSIGYMSDNTVPCCFECNAMKRDMDLKLWLSLMREIIQNMDNKKA